MFSLRSNKTHNRKTVPDPVLHPKTFKKVVATLKIKHAA